MSRVRIHDLFDGLSHCKECNGPCRLAAESPAEYALSLTMRFALEQLALCGQPAGSLLRGVITDAGANPDRFEQRAKDNADPRTAE